EQALTETRLRREKDALTNRVLQANQELQRRLTEFEILYNVGKVVTSTMDLNRLLPEIVNAAVQITNAEEGYIILVEAEQLVRRAHKVPHSETSRPVAEPTRDRIAQYVIDKRESIALGPDRLRRGSQSGALSVASVPLRIGERTLGALQVVNHSDDSRIFARNDTMMLQALSDYAAISIENSHNYAAVQASAEKVQDTFERFVAPSVVQKALTDDVELGGERQEISVVFADIRGYTSFSENESPEKVVEVLNHYLSVAGGIIIGWEGTLDKFFGDGLMAIFNAPKKQDDHVHRAAEAAIAIIKAAEEINNVYGYDLAYSVGVHVGEAVVGYIGTNYAVNYTAIGDTVNLAKRLQEYAEPGQILVEEAVIERLGTDVRARLLGDIKVKGRQTVAKAYELVDI
ncbi:MAG: adenylate/guanylate cyclase domain-containing protein, partial [Chloroflexota bacterium]